MAAWRLPLAYLLAMATIAAWASLWTRHGNTVVCEEDGQELPPALQVDLEMTDRKPHHFCSIVCAQRWLIAQAAEKLKAATVRDALTGEPLDAYAAFFVQNDIVTNHANGNNIHAFRFRTDAQEQIRRFGGQFIEDPLAAP
jgi:hypothetical protein